MSIAPPELHAVQARFLQALTRTDDDFLQELRPAAGIPAERRLEIYRNAYRSRLIEALEALLPLTARWLGPADFEAWAADYVQAHPPATWSLREYGCDFGDWLHHTAPTLAAAAELARLEAALRMAFDGPDADVLTLSPLLTLEPSDWLRLTVRFHPVVAPLRVLAGTVEVWQALQAGDAPATDREAPSESVALLIWRRDGQSCFRPLSPPLAELAAALRAGQTFAGACIAAELSADAGAAALVDWIRDGLIADYALVGE